MWLKVLSKTISETGLSTKTLTSKDFLPKVSLWVYNPGVVVESTTTDLVCKTPINSVTGVTAVAPLGTVDSTLYETGVVPIMFFSSAVKV